MINLKPGEIVSFNNREYIIEDFTLSGESIILKDLITKRPLIVKTSELVNAVYNISRFFLDNLSSFIDI
jgi:hypothetical protein